MNSFLKPNILRLLCLKLFFIANFAFAQALVTQTLASQPLSYNILAERTHKPTLFTQGLVIHDGYFYESSGLYEKSMLVSYPVAEPETAWAKLSAPFTNKHMLPKNYFAEGLTLLNDKLYLLTWQEKTLLIFDKKTLNYEKSMNYQGEGWGLTTNGSELIRSDGSENLFFHSAKDFSVIKTLKVMDGETPVKLLNELEFVQGHIWANIWYQDSIVKINLETGKVLERIDLSALKQKMQLTSSENVLNGIAWDEQKQAFWITGKNWPKLFLIKLKP